MSLEKILLPSKSPIISSMSLPEQSTIATV